MGNYLVFLPETVLILTALATVVLGFRWSRRPVYLWGLALGGVALALFLVLDMMGLGVTSALGLSQIPSPVGTAGNFSADLRLNVDAFALFFQAIFLFVAFLAVLASRGYIRAEEPHQGEYYGLMLLAVVGMMFTAAATDLFVLVLAFETSSLSTFGLVAFRKKDRSSTEAAVKFFIIGAISSSITLFGISLLYGVTGSTSIGATLDLVRMGTALGSVSGTAFEAPLIVALILLIAGFGFKAAVVPFHMWAPDVYQGSPTTISTFLAAGSKKVGVVALLRVFLIGLMPIQIDWIVAFVIVAIATQTLGNILALSQRSIKRMLAYSSIAQIGYIMIAIPVASVATQATPPYSMADPAVFVATTAVVGAMLHALTHAAMKGGAFLVVAGTESGGIPDDLDAYRGLGRRMPFLALAMTLFLLSLAGIPPLAGFFSKFILFSSAVYAMQFNPWFLALAISGVLNSALSLYYYARVMWYMYILAPAGEVRRTEAPRSISGGVFLALAVVVLTTVLAGFYLSFLYSAAQQFLFP